MKGFLKKSIEIFKAPKLFTLCIVWTVTLLAVAGALVCVFVGYTGVLSYVVYVVAACSLGYTVYTLVRCIPTIKEQVKEKLKSKKFTRELTENYSFRTLVLSVCSFAVNLSFVAFNTIFSILTKNEWYASLAGYYFLLGFLRGGVFWADKRAKKAAKTAGEYRQKQLKNYRVCGVALFVLDMAMAVAVTFMVLDQKPTKYTEITAIVFAAYSFYKISLAIWNIFKAKKTNDPQIQALRNIGLVDAAISLLSLQVTLLSTFSAEGENMSAMNAATGAGVCLLTMGLGILMIVQATKGIKEERENERKEFSLRIQRTDGGRTQGDSKHSTSV